jgi:TolB-like protein/Flp pilus assembly protein TadD
MRKLAAIMFTDIVGYSALMSKDESQALRILEENRELHRSALGQFNGEYVKEVGDGTLSIFQSSWDAVSCALEIQRLLSHSAAYRLRIGIHIGDIVFSDKDVFGDGVNIASRIQGLCEPGGICVSERVYEDIKNKAGMKALCIGKKSLKNIALPVNIYSIETEFTESLQALQKQGRNSLQRPVQVREGAPTSSRRKAILGTTLVILIGLVLAVIYLAFHQRPWLQRILSGTEEESNKEGESAWPNSIAVLPFIDLSPAKDQEYFCDGMSEELINVMANIPGLKVVARTSAFSFKGKGMDVREIGRKLKVKTILEGSVRKAGEQLRISAQLVNVKNGYHLWSKNFDRELKDVFTIQDEIASEIVASLKTKLLPEERELIGRNPTENTEAYQLYLKGRFYWNKRTEEDLQKAIGYFRQAIGMDAGFATAYAALASAYVLLPEYSGLPSKDYNLKAKEAADKALELDHTLAEPHATLGLIKIQTDYDWAGAEYELQRAIELNPNSPTAHHWYSFYLRFQGKLDDALAESMLALELDPLSLVIGTNVGWIYYFMRQFDRAKEQFQKTIELDPDFHTAYNGLAEVLTYQGKYEEALAVLGKASAGGRPDLYGRTLVGFIYARTGRKKEALEIIGEFTAVMQQGRTLSLAVAAVYGGLEDWDKTFAWLDKAYENREVGLAELKISPSWEKLRPDRRYAVLMEKMGLDK